MEGQVHEAVISNMFIAGHGTKALPKLGLATIRPLQTMSIVTHTQQKFTKTMPPYFFAMYVLYNPTLRRISNNEFSPRYMGYANRLALGEIGDPLQTSLNVFLRKCSGRLTTKLGLTCTRLQPHHLRRTCLRGNLEIMTIGRKCVVASCD